MGVVSAPPVIPELKSQALKLTAIPICRQCFVKHFSEREIPTMPYPSKDGCSVKQCENESAYIVALMPSQFIE